MMDEGKALLAACCCVLTRKESIDQNLEILSDKEIECDGELRYYATKGTRKVSVMSRLSTMNNTRDNDLTSSSVW